MSANLLFDDYSSKRVRKERIIIRKQAKNVVRQERKQNEMRRTQSLRQNRHQKQAFYNDFITPFAEEVDFFIPAHHSLDADVASPVSFPVDTAEDSPNAEAPSVNNSIIPDSILNGVHTALKIAAPLAAVGILLWQRCRR